MIFGDDNLSVRNEASLWVEIAGRAYLLSDPKDAAAVQQYREWLAKHSDVK